MRRYINKLDRHEIAFTIFTVIILFFTWALTWDKEGWYWLALVCATLFVIIVVVVVLTRLYELILEFLEENDIGRYNN